MFDFLKKNKEYMSCEWLEYGIHFSPFGLFHCCMYNPYDNADAPVVPVKKNRYDIDKFYKIKKQTIKQHKKGIINNRCIGCYDLKKAIWPKCKTLKHIVLNINYKCDCDCIYCLTHLNKKIYNKINDIPIIDILKSNIKKHIIDKDSEIHIGGGEPVLHKEFDEIISLFLSNGIKKLKIYSSGIKYSSSISKALECDACQLIISPDSGDSELYKKIKNIDGFDNVWANIEKYCGNQNLDKNAVCAKYILIPDVNDNIEAINSFLSKVQQVNCRSIITDIERSWYQKNTENDEYIKKLISLMKYMETFSSANGINHIYYPACVYVINDYKDFYNSCELIDV